MNVLDFLTAALEYQPSRTARTPTRRRARRPRPKPTTADEPNLILELFGTRKPKAPGIDLSKKWLDVRKIFMAHFGRQTRNAGYDPEDVLQEVYRGILARNAETSGWDPTRGTFGRYVYIVCSSVLRNYLKSQNRHRVLILGCRGYDDADNWGTVDASTQAVSPCTPDDAMLAMVSVVRTMHADGIEIE